MFSSKSKFEQLTADVLIRLASFLTIKTLLQLSLTSKTFQHLINDESVFKALVKRDYRVLGKEENESWVDVYKRQEETEDVIDTTEPIVVPEATVVSTIEAVEVFTEETLIATESVVEEAKVVSAETSVVEEPVTTKEPAIAKEEETPVVEDTVKGETITEEEDEIMTDAPNINGNHECSHFKELPGLVQETKRIIYSSYQQEPFLCDSCSSNPALYLNMSDSHHEAYCADCYSVTDLNCVVLDLTSAALLCFACKSNGLRLHHDTSYLHDPEDLDKRRKAEQQMYIQELRREDMSLKHYLLEKQWGRTWMLFRTREGSPLPTKITNSKLARLNGTLDPNIRLPMDKYRPSPETHGDIVSSVLWGFLVKAYGVQGRSYSEDDILAPEYARLRVYVDDYKKSIHLYP